jgi:hypothetical protein
MASDQPEIEGLFLITISNNGQEFNIYRIRTPDLDSAVDRINTIWIYGQMCIIEPDVQLTGDVFFVGKVGTSLKMLPMIQRGFHTSHFEVSN